MSTRPFRRFKPGDRALSASELNRLLDTVEQHDKPSVAGGFPLRVANIGGKPQIYIDQRRVIWIEITGTPSGSAYPWSELRDDGDGVMEVLDEGREGTTSALPAYEVLGNTEVAIGSICPAWLSDDKESYLFYAAGGGPTTTHNFAGDVTINGGLTVNTISDFYDTTTFHEEAIFNQYVSFLQEVDYGGPLTVTNQLFFSSQTLSLGSGSVTNLSITNQAPILYLTATGAVSWYSIDSSTSNLWYYLYNSSAYTITIKHDDGATGTDTERFYSPGSADVSLSPGSWGYVWYDQTQDRWLVTTFGNVAGGTFTGPVTFNDIVTFSDPIVYTPATASISANQNNYTPLDSANWHVDVTGTRDLTGLDATGISDGTTYYVTNVGSGEWVFKYNSGSSTTGNKLFTNTAQDYALKTNQTARVEYNDTFDSSNGGWLVTPLQIGGSAYVDASGKLITQTTASGSAGFNVPQGTTPSSPANGDVWSTSTAYYAYINGATQATVPINSDGTYIPPASSTTRAGLNLPHGTAPTSPANGDVWTTTTAMFVQINGSTIQLGAGGSLADGDYGDVTVSSSGTVITIDAGVVTYAKLQAPSSASILLGQGSGGGGVFQEITLGDHLSMDSTTLKARIIPAYIAPGGIGSGNVDEWDPGGTWDEIDGTLVSPNPAGGTTLRSMSAATLFNGFVLGIHNLSDTVTLKIAQATEGVAGIRFYCPLLQDYYLLPYQTVWCWYSTSYEMFFLGSPGALNLDDPGADAVRGWDDSAGKEAYLSASDVRTAIGLAIGTNVQAWSANLDEYSAVNPTAAGLALLDDADAAAQRTTLGLGTLATQSGTFSGTSSGTNTGDQPAASVVQRTYDEYTANTNLTTTIPQDDTIPQNTEGTEILSRSITPTSGSNRLRITFTGIATGSTVDNVFVALFVDSTANALKTSAFSVLVSSGTYISTGTLVYELSAASTSARTYKIRVGASSATIRLNGSTSSRFFGGTMGATMVIEEIVP